MVSRDLAVVMGKILFNIGYLGGNIAVKTERSSCRHPSLPDTQRPEIELLETDRSRSVSEPRPRTKTPPGSDSTPPVILVQFSFSICIGNSHS